MQMSTPNREILARFAASLRGHQDGGLLYVGALRELYERDNLPIPGGLDFGQGRMVGFEISICNNNNFRPRERQRAQKGRGWGRP